MRSGEQLDQLHDIESKLALMISIVNDYEEDDEEEEQYLDNMHRHMMKAHAYLTYLLDLIHYKKEGNQ